MDIEEIREFCLSLPNTSEEMPFGEDFLVFKTHEKIFCLIPLAFVPQRINLKCNPELAVYFREQYLERIVAGYHMNKRHWNTLLVENLPTDLVKKSIIHSYELVLEKLPKKILQTVDYQFQYPFKEILDNI